MAVKTSVCVNISSTLNTIEFIVYDVANKEFPRLDHESFSFDLGSRQPSDDPERLKTTIKRLYERNQVPTRSLTTLVLPSYFTRDYQIPEGIMPEEVPTLLLSEAERFYAFKKLEPEVGHFPLTETQMFYTAYPKSALNVLESVFVDLKIPIATIDINYTATLRGLAAMGVVEQEIQERLKWLFLVVSDNSVFMSLMEGFHIEKTTEIPLANFGPEEHDEMLNQIRDDFSHFCEFEILNRIIIINNSQTLYSTMLVEKLDFENINVFDQNERTLKSMGAEEAPYPCSLEAIGGALAKHYPVLPSVGLNKVDYFAQSQIKARKDIIGFTALGIGLFIFLSQWGLASLINHFNQNEQEKGGQLNREIQTARQSFLVVPEVKKKLFVQEGINQNHRINNLIVKAALALPADAWLNNIYVRNHPSLNQLQVEIEGASLSSRAIDTYVKELNDTLPKQTFEPRLVPKTENGEDYIAFTLVADIPKE